MVSWRQALLRHSERRRSRSAQNTASGTAPRFPPAPGAARIQEAAPAIAKDTSGEVELQVYPNSQLGSEPDMFSQVRSGALDFMSTSGVNQTVVPVGGINAVAFAFDDYSKVWAAMDGGSRPVKLAIDEDANDDRVDDADGGDFRGGRDPLDHGRADHDRQAEAGNRDQEQLALVAPGEAARRRESSLLLCSHTTTERASMPTTAGTGRR